MTAAVYDQTDTDTRCRFCEGPCLTFKGSVWEWTCQGCIAAYLDDQIARLDGRCGGDASTPVVAAAPHVGSGDGGGAGSGPTIAVAAELPNSPACHHLSSRFSRGTNTHADHDQTPAHRR